MQAAFTQSTTDATNHNVHHGDLVAEPGKTYDCEEITGPIYASGADTKTAFPKLTKTNDPDAGDVCRRSLFNQNLKIGYYFADGILARLIARRGHVARVVICGKIKTSYVVDDGTGSSATARTVLLAVINGRAGLAKINGVATVIELPKADPSEFYAEWNSTLSES